MTSIEIKKLKQIQKDYLKNFFKYEFDSLFQLIFELFNNYLHGQKKSSK